MTKIDNKTILLFVLVLILAFSRLIPHPPNFTPLLGMAVFAGAMFDKKVFAFLAPLAAMFLSDIIIGFHSGMPIIYVAIAINVSIGTLLINKFTYFKSFLALISGSLAFFIITNFAVWIGSGMYTLDINGLIACYVMAIPFFQNTLISTALFGLGSFYLFNLFEQKILLLAKNS